MVNYFLPRRCKDTILHHDYFINFIKNNFILPVIRTTHLSPTSCFGIWHINETIDALRLQIVLSEEEEKLYLTFKNELRCKQWLSYRLLIRSILPYLKTYTVLYNKLGAPLILNSTINISVSHAGNYAVVIANNSNKVGIDIELIHPRIQKVAHRFLKAEELSSIQGPTSEKKLCVLWCVKEAVYKYCGIDGLDFANEIIVAPFELLNTGSVNVKVIYQDRTQSLVLNYETMNDYILAYVV